MNMSNKVYTFVLYTISDAIFYIIILYYALCQADILMAPPSKVLRPVTIIPSLTILCYVDSVQR